MWRCECSSTSFCRTRFPQSDAHDISTCRKMHILRIISPPPMFRSYVDNIIIIIRSLYCVCTRARVCAIKIRRRHGDRTSTRIVSSGRAVGDYRVHHGCYACSWRVRRRAVGNNICAPRSCWGTTNVMDHRESGDTRVIRNIRFKPPQCFMYGWCEVARALTGLEHLWFLLVGLKEKVFKHRPNTLEELKERIKVEIGAKCVKMRQKTSEIAFINVSLLAAIIFLM